MSKINSTIPPTTIAAIPSAQEKGLEQTQARIVGHTQSPLTSPSHVQYLNSSVIETPQIKITDKRPAGKKIISLPPQEQISGFRAHDQAYISYLESRKKPLAKGKLWLKDEGQFNCCDFQEWFELTHMVYLPYLLFSEKNMLERFKLNQSHEPNWEAHAALLDRLYLKKISGQVGWGVFARTDLAIGQSVGEYTGVVHAYQTGGTYTMLYEEIPGCSLNIDARFMGNITRLINHSETPNIEAIQIIATDGIAHVEFKVIKTIQSHQQLLIDYGPNYWIYQKPQRLEV